MPEVENYKELSPGAVLPSEDRIAFCARCGRPGIERLTQDGAIWVHAESLEMLPDGLLVEPVDYCLTGPLPFAVSHPDFI